MVEGGYEAWPSLDELFPVSYQGVEPSRGLADTVVDTDENKLGARIRQYLGADTFKKAGANHPGFLQPFARYDAEKEWRAAKASGFDQRKIVADLMFPFDQRHLYYEMNGKWLNESRPEFGGVLNSNEFFVTVPEPRKLSESRPVFSSTLVNRHVHERGSAIFPTGDRRCRPPGGSRR
jgi:hypothetical protein